MIKGRSCQLAGARARRRYWRGLRGGRRKETVTLHQPPVTPRRRSILCLGCGLGTSDRWCRTPSTSRKWGQQYKLSITHQSTSLKTDWVRKFVCC